MAPLVLLGTLLLCLSWQGAYHPRGQLLLCAGLLATMATAVIDRPWRPAELAWPPVALLAALGLWTAANGLIHSSTHLALGGVALTGAVAVTVSATRRFNQADRTVLIGALPFAGAFLALSGWLGLIARVPGWSQGADGLWRAAGVLSYSNALAATLAMLAVLGIALLSPASDRGTGAALPTSPAVLCLTTMLLVAVLLATLSRAGMLSFTAGLATLVGGGRAQLRAAIAPLAGGSIAFVGLVPSLPTASRPHPGLAVGGLLAGALAAELLRRTPVHPSANPRRVRTLAPVLLGSAALGLLVAAGPVRPMLWNIIETRLGSGSSYRLPAARQALSAWAERPVDGLGSGGATMTWRDGTGAQITLRYLHNEYLQVLVEQGVVGATLLLAAAAAAARVALEGGHRVLRPCRPAGTAALAAFAVSSGFDITWHVPALPVLAASIYAAALTPELQRNSDESLRAEALTVAHTADHRKDHEP